MWGDRKIHCPKNTLLSLLSRVQWSRVAFSGRDDPVRCFSADPHSSCLSTSLDNTAIFKRFCLFVVIVCVIRLKKDSSSWSSKWLWATHCEFWEPVASSLNWWASSLCYSPQTIIVLSPMMLIVNPPLNFDFGEAQGMLLEGSNVPSLSYRTPRRSSL